MGDGSGRVKCIVSSVPFFPDYEDGSDQWGEFWHQRDKVIDYCVEKNIKKVLSITGDIHVSYTSVLTKPGTDFQMIQVISSPIFWPFGHGSVDDFPNIGNSGKAELNGRPEFKINTPTKVIATDNFSRLDITPSGMQVRVYSRKGEALDDNSFTF